MRGGALAEQSAECRDSEWWYNHETAVGRVVVMRQGGSSILLLGVGRQSEAWAVVVMAKSRYAG